MHAAENNARFCHCWVRSDDCRVRPMSSTSARRKPRGRPDIANGTDSRRALAGDSRGLRAAPRIWRFVGGRWTGMWNWSPGSERSSPDLPVVFFGGPEDRVLQSELFSQIRMANSIPGDADDPACRGPRRAGIRVPECGYRSCTWRRRCGCHTSSSLRRPRSTPCILPLWDDWTLIPNPGVAGRALDFYRYDGRPIQGTSTEIQRLMESVTTDSVLAACVRHCGRSLRHRGILRTGIDPPRAGVAAVGGDARRFRGIRRREPVAGLPRKGFPDSPELRSRRAHARRRISFHSRTRAEGLLPDIRVDSR